MWTILDAKINHIRSGKIESCLGLFYKNRYMFVFIFSHGCIMETSLDIYLFWLFWPIASYLFFLKDSFLLQTGLELTIVTQACPQLTKSCHSFLSINITDMSLQFLPCPLIVGLFLFIEWHMLNILFSCWLFYRPHFWSRMRDFCSKT